MDNLRGGAIRFQSYWLRTDPCIVSRDTILGQQAAHQTGVSDRQRQLRAAGPFPLALETRTETPSWEEGFGQ